MKFGVDIDRVNDFEVYFLLTEDDRPYVASDDFISKSLGIEVKEYHQRLVEKVVNEVDHIVDVNEAYFNLKENDEVGKKLLIDKFKEEFVTELISLNLSQSESL